MNYTEIKNAALAYADKATHTETSDSMDDFLRVVEARVNRHLKTNDMSKQATLTSLDGKYYYGLPDDFNGLRGDPQVPGANNTIQTFRFMTPEQMNNINHLSNVSEHYYTIIADQFRIFPDLDAEVITITYYQRIVALDGTNTSNWLSTDNPDVYIFGCLVEIASFNKDAVAREIWDARFKEALNEVSIHDQMIRWSSNTMQTRPG